MYGKGTREYETVEGQILRGRLEGMSQNWGLAGIRGKINCWRSSVNCAASVQAEGWLMFWVKTENVEES